MTFGEKLRESRKTSNLTQKQLADKIGAKHNSVSDWENDKNKPDPDTIELLCGVLGISPNYLLNSNSDDFSLFEKELIKKYRELDEDGKEVVDFVLQKEWDKLHSLERHIEMGGLTLFDVCTDNIEERDKMIYEACTPETANKLINLLEERDKRKNNRMVNAAHVRTDIDIPEDADTSEDDIMDDENF